MPEVELTSGMHRRILTVPGAARLTGEVELSQTVHGFYPTALTATMLTEHPLGVAQPATLISEAECVDVLKKAGEVWIAGDWIYWHEATSNFSNIPAADLYCVGKAQRAAVNAAVRGYVAWQDNYHPVRLGTAAVPVTIIAATQPIAMHTTCSVVANIEPMLISTVLTGVGATGGRARFNLATEVVLGGWANALKAQFEFGTNGAITGLASAFCAEMTMPGSTPAGGNYAPLELELNLPASSGLGTQTAFQFMSANGANVAAMDTSGFLFILNGLTVGADKLFDTCTAAAASHALRISIDGVAYYILLNDNVDA